MALLTFHASIIDMDLVAEPDRLFFLAVEHFRECPPTEDQRDDQADEERRCATTCAFATVFVVCIG
ncbi:hypothetical protein DVU_0695 [Nitratidesulfovibrio vulgaris str. Hildenborough]|uniref:Uncharacterized protein n=1 Tax=Nitratidesulfovibrio vulgaris (strain ATCC 29579 / DSM 644 / CCUG 34227 / NCIMB 8303 / VKM B-1760 / Hildenborough) TaxID=882 RepID=Q72E83_NITV2|nr:hypothetical protein DVU_0695 [Nitratidesulfovibrio vulgaris str. Hildenborough]